ncbi:MAG: hypothetical protein H6525_01720 [Actinobacteria bacterium]|nr:hypothetical protein [Actinomycetota bacterium]MCB9411558.1 hypothetical protein [Actinomycetota bacterium]
MTAQVTETTATAQPTRSGRGRGVVAWLLVVVVSLLLPLGVVAFWGQRTITDTERYVETVAPLVEEEAIKTAIVDRTTSTLMTLISESDVVTDAVSALPPAAAEKLLPAVSSAIQSLVSQVASRIVNSDQFEEFWVVANKTLQESLIRVLSGDEADGAIQLSGDQVVLDTAPIAEAVQAELVDRGLTALEGKPLPPAADQQIVLLENSQLAEARLIYEFTIPIARYLIPALAVLVLLAVAISTRRARLVMGIGIGIAVGMAVLASALGIAQTFLAGAAPNSQAQAVLNVFWTTLTRYLDSAVWAWFTVGVIVALLGWFGGRSGPATSIRSAISGGLTRAGSVLGGGPVGGLGNFLAAHWRAVFIGIGVLATASLFLFDSIGAATVLWVAVISLTLTAVVTWLSGAAGPAAPADNG